MFLIYIACLVFGGVLLVMAMMAGGDGADHELGTHGDVSHDLGGHADFSHELAGDTDMAHDLSTEGGIDAHTELAAHGDASLHTADAGHAAMQHAHANAADAVRYLSFRNFVFFMAFFGLTGTVLTTLAIPSLITAISAAGMGVFASQVGYRLMRYLKGSETGQAVDLGDLRGHTGTVLVGCGRTQTGKITVHSGTQTLTLLAQVATEERRAHFKPGDTVIISRVERGIAHVIDGRLLDDHPPTQLT